MTLVTLIGLSQKGLGIPIQWLESHVNQRDENPVCLALHVIDDPEAGTKPEFLSCEQAMFSPLFSWKLVVFTTMFFQYFVHII